MQRISLGLLPLCLLVLAFGWAGCDSNEEAEVEIEDLIIGTGPAAETGMRVRVAYVGRLENDLVFDESDSFEVTLSSARLIEGFRRGIEGMQVGGKRRVTIPPELAYGRQGAGCTASGCLIPADATLIFNIDLLALCDPAGGTVCF